jgi:Holliday junction resolvasome RuvABC endonuclease subunit
MAKKQKKVYNLFQFDKSFVGSGQIVAGLDLSLNHTGIVLLNDQGQIIYQEAIILKNKQLNKRKFHVVKFKVNNEYIDEEIEVSNEENEIDQLKRVCIIRDRVIRVLKDFKVNHIAIEGYNMGRTSNQGFVYQIGELAGIIKVMLHENKYDVQLVPPTTLKKYITGSGAAKKEDMQEWIYKKYFLVFEDDNEADAFALAKIFLELGGELKTYCTKDAARIYEIQMEAIHGKKE